MNDMRRIEDEVGRGEGKPFKATLFQGARMMVGESAS